ncbi:hypothetical protein CR513_07961 [Mucuna pruriens]|uniref:Uncharacterized protein n=1 Tax=Mucuna pruriens TaxID=157652 RepID=A0A371HYR3_MUCPR|nr:hypothetical protein CR513_07961 [Mucuna pruriens]
MHLNGSDLP